MQATRAVTSDLFDVLEARILTIFRQYRKEVRSIRYERKPDQTLLSEADLTMQAAIVQTLTEADPSAGIVSEEGIRRGNPTRTWVVDPIDGTREFLKDGATEFCSAVCLVEHGMPTEALIVAPELGRDRSALVIRAWGTRQLVEVNGEPASAPKLHTASPLLISATRSSGTSPRSFENTLSDCSFKTKTTSQIIDLIRLTVDLSGRADDAEAFDLFLRINQWIWDGAPGHLLALIRSYDIVDEYGNPLLPYVNGLLSSVEPRLDSVVCGPPELVGWFFTAIEEKRGSCLRSGDSTIPEDRAHWGSEAQSR